MAGVRHCVVLTLHVLLCAAGIGAGFYLGYSWLPSFFANHAGISSSTTLWMVSEPACGHKTQLRWLQGQMCSCGAPGLPVSGSELQDT